MVFHELATNAAKYGALSAPGGRLAVCWTVERPARVGDGPSRLRLAWRESDGPPVVVPERRGFGSRLIERSTGELDGEAELQFTAEGFCYSLAMPLNAANSLAF
jgi:two-component sensor histidine kinase